MRKTADKITRYMRGSPSASTDSKELVPFLPLEKVSLRPLEEKSFQRLPGLLKVLPQAVVVTLLKYCDDVDLRELFLTNKWLSTQTRTSVTQTHLSTHLSTHPEVVYHLSQSLKVSGNDVTALFEQKLRTGTRQNLTNLTVVVRRTHSITATEGNEELWRRRYCAENLPNIVKNNPRSATAYFIGMLMVLIGGLLQNKAVCLMGVGIVCFLAIMATGRYMKNVYMRHYSIPLQRQQLRPLLMPPRPAVGRSGSLNQEPDSTEMKVMAHL